MNGSAADQVWGNFGSLLLPRFMRFPPPAPQPSLPPKQIWLDYTLDFNSAYIHVRKLVCAIFSLVVRWRVQLAQAGLTGGPKGGFGAKQVSDTCLEKWNRLTKEFADLFGLLKCNTLYAINFLAHWLIVKDTIGDIFCILPKLFSRSTTNNFWIWR